MGKSGHDDKTDTAHGRDAILDELNRLDAPAEKPAGPQPVHVYRPPKAAHHVGMIGAVFGVFSDMFRGGASHAGPVIARFIIIVAIVGGLGYGGLRLLRGFDKSSTLRRDLDKRLAEYEKPIRSTANDLIHKAKLNTFVDTVDFKLDPVINEIPLVVNFECYRGEDLLNIKLGTGVLASGAINLQTRSFTIRVASEGNTVATDRIELPPAVAPPAK